MPFCAQCGTRLPDDAKFCFSCGRPQVTAGASAAVPPPFATRTGTQPPPYTTQPGMQPPFAAQPGTQPPPSAAQPGMQQPPFAAGPGTQQPPYSAQPYAAAQASYAGFSPRVESPEVAAWKKKNRNGTVIATLVLAVVALVAILIFAGEALGNALMAWAAVVALSALFSFIGFASNNRTWEGVIENKRLIERRVSDEDSVRGYSIERRPTLFIRMNNGRKLKHVVRSIEAFEYYQVGDHLRKHAGLTLPERYLKGSENLCLSCGTRFPATQDQCPKCRLPAIR